MSTNSDWTMTGSLDMLNEKIFGPGEKLFTAVGWYTTESDSFLLVPHDVEPERFILHSFNSVHMRETFKDVAHLPLFKIT